MALEMGKHMHIFFYPNIKINVCPWINYYHIEYCNINMKLDIEKPRLRCSYLLMIIIRNDGNNGSKSTTLSSLFKFGSVRGYLM